MQYHEQNFRGTESHEWIQISSQSLQAQMKGKSESAETRSYQRGRKE